MNIPAIAATAALAIGTAATGVALMVTAAHGDVAVPNTHAPEGTSFDFAQYVDMVTGQPAERHTVTTIDELFLPGGAR